MHETAGPRSAQTQGGAPPRFDFAIEAHAAGEASASELALLESLPDEWRAGLRRLLDETEAQLAAVRTLKGPDRDQVIADFERERSRLAAALRQLEGPSPDSGEQGRDDSGEVRLQASWASGRVVLWAAGSRTAPAGPEELVAR